MLDHPVDLIDGVDDTLTYLAETGYRLVIVTKGDLHHQEMKVMASGLADRVDRIEIVAEKDVGHLPPGHRVDGRRARASSPWSATR